MPECGIPEYRRLARRDERKVVECRWLPAPRKPFAAGITGVKQGQTLRMKHLLKHALQQTCRDEDKNAGASKRRDNAQP